MRQNRHKTFVFSSNLAAQLQYLDKTSLSEPLKNNIPYILFGRVNWFKGKPSIPHPEMDLESDFIKKHHNLFYKDNLQNTLGEVLSNNGKTQIRIAETEKYPHVSFFFSGGDFCKTTRKCD